MCPRRGLEARGDARGGSILEYLTLFAILVGAVITTLSVALPGSVERAAESIGCQLGWAAGSGVACEVNRADAREPQLPSPEMFAERDLADDTPRAGMSEQALVDSVSEPLAGVGDDELLLSVPPGAAVAAGLVVAGSAFAPSSQPEPKPQTVKPSGGNRSGSGSGNRPGGFRLQFPKPGPFSWFRLSPLALALTAINLYVLEGDVTPLQSIETESGPVTLAYNQPGLGGDCLSIDGLKACRHASLPFAEEELEIRTTDGTLLATRQGDELILEPEALTERARQAQRWSLESLWNWLPGVEDTTPNRPLELPNRVVFWSLSNDGTEVRMTLRDDGSLHQEVWRNGELAPHLIRRVVRIPVNTCGDACKHLPVNENGHAQFVCDENGICTGVVCFAEGTPVQTPSGRQPIETLQPGDLVLARDPETGRTEWKAVARTFETPNRPLRRLVLRQELSGTVWFDELEATAEHPFHVPDVGWRPVRSLGVGDRVVTQDGRATVVENTSLGGKHTVFNLEVEDFHTYFVGEIDAWVHNTCDDDDQRSEPKSRPPTAVRDFAGLRWDPATGRLTRTGIPETDLPLSVPMSYVDVLVLEKLVTVSGRPLIIDVEQGKRLAAALRVFDSPYRIAQVVRIPRLVRRSQLSLASHVAYTRARRFGNGLGLSVYFGDRWATVRGRSGAEKVPLATGEALEAAFSNPGQLVPSEHVRHVQTWLNRVHDVLDKVGYPRPRIDDVKQAVLERVPSFLAPDGAIFRPASDPAQRATGWERFFDGALEVQRETGEIYGNNTRMRLPRHETELLFDLLDNPDGLFWTGPDVVQTLNSSFSVVGLGRPVRTVPSPTADDPGRQFLRMAQSAGELPVLIEDNPVLEHLRGRAIAFDADMVRAHSNFPGIDAEQFEAALRSMSDEEVRQLFQRMANAEQGTDGVQAAHRILAQFLAGPRFRRH